VTDSHSSVRDPSSRARFVGVGTGSPATPNPWPPLKVSASEIEEEIHRLVDEAPGPGGRRAATIVHPLATEPGLGLAPGVDVTIEVLKPGEQTVPLRRNSSQVEIAIHGCGTVQAGGRAIELGELDVCTIPSMKPYFHRNTGRDNWVRLSYSNAPLLTKLGVDYAEQLTGGSAESSAPPESRSAGGNYTRENAPDFVVSDSGAKLRGYEFLVDIEPIPNDALHWPWAEVSQHLSSRVGDGKRSIMALYNPATGRRQGATHSFFVTAARMPPGTPARRVGRGHRHSSVAINYHFAGAGTSIVDGEEIDWVAGDLLLSAPGWREHSHHPGPEGFGIFTVQDHPLQIAMESLIWQEDMDGPILTLGAEAGQTGYVGPREAGD
jgi:gentisate 1,2-dioxygenase